MSTALDICKETPLFVWIILLVLLARGISALKDREIRIYRLFLLPTAFFIWSLITIIYDTSYVLISVLTMIAFVISSTAFSWYIFRNQPPLLIKANSNLVVKKGSFLTLILLLMTFAIKFIITYILKTNTELLFCFKFNILFSTISGILDGIFWGILLRLFIPWYKTKISNR